MKDRSQSEGNESRDLDGFAMANAESLLGALAGMFSFPSPAMPAETPASAPAVDERNASASLEIGVRYRTLLEQIPAVVFMAVLEDGRSEAYVSPHIESVLGFNRDEWLDDPIRWYYQLHPDDRGRWNIEAANFLLTGHPLRSTYRVLARDGRIVWFHGEAKMVRRPDGQPWFIHGVGFDITDLKQAEQELKHARDELEVRVQERTAELQKANAELKSEIADRIKAQTDLARRAEELARTNTDLEQFAYAASHDLQEPIRNVSISSQILSRRYQHIVDQDGGQLLEAIVSSAKHMERLVLDLLEYTRVARGSGEDENWSDAGEVFRKVLENLKSVIATSGASVTCGKLPFVTLPAVRLQQVFQNLVSNAIKYQDVHPPRIHVSAEAVEGGWLFSVEDNGIGISPKYHDRIFGIFKRLHTKDKYPGTGIGLAICKRVVEDAGGKIWVESDVGKGAQFKFFIPESPRESTKLFRI